jgi:hypothetical protein
MRLRTGLPLRAVTISLVLGALINACIACALALRLDPQFATLSAIDQTNRAQVSDEELSRMQHHPWAMRYSDDQIALGIESIPGVERRVAEIMPYWSAALAANSEHALVMVNDLCTRIRAGWPCLALEGERWMAADRGEGINPFDANVREISDIYHHRWLAPVKLGGPRMYIQNSGTATCYPRLLPLRPLWPGFAINTLLYAPIIWLLLFAPLALRRVIRRQRNLCERCGYPRGPSTICSECGASLPCRPFAPEDGRRSLDFPAAQVH